MQLPSSNQGQSIRLAISGQLGMLVGSDLYGVTLYWEDGDISSVTHQEFKDLVESGTIEIVPGLEPESCG